MPQVGSQTPVYAVNSEFAALKDRNEQQRRRVDDVLTKRLQLEKRAKEVSEHQGRSRRVADDKSVQQRC